MYRTLFPNSFLADLDRLQREFLRYSGPTGSIRGFGRGGFPALNRSMQNPVNDGAKYLS